MSSLIDLVNDSLAQIGEAPINGLDDGTTKSDICKTHTPIVLRAMLYDHRWNFARVRVSLAADAAAPVSGFSYAYTLPGDCLRVWGIGDGNYGYLDWKREGDKILTDAAAPLIVHYNRYTEQPNEWSGAFALAFSVFLASRLAGSLAHDARMAQAFMQNYYSTLLPSALGANGQEGSQEIIESDDLLVVRDG